MPAPLQAIVDQLVAFVVHAVPRLLVALAAIAVLLVVAALVEAVLRRVLRRLPLAALLTRVGADTLLAKAGVADPPHVWLPRLVYWLLILLFTRIAADAYGVTAVSGAIGALFAYLPKVLAALVLVLVGSALARTASGAVTRAATAAGIEFARPLGATAGAFVLFVVGAMAVGQLEFDTAMVRLVTGCILGALALAFALSLGLGTREVTRNVMAGFYARKLFQPGDVLEVGGRRGVLRAIAPTQTLLEVEGGGVVCLSNGVFLDAAGARSGV